MEPLVSVIMGVYNQYNKEELDMAVASILDQSYKNIEFIIWDDGSDSEAAALLQDLPSRDKRIILAGREDNRGLAFSLNECIRLAHGKYIARMDADDISYPGRIKKQISFLEAHPEYGWCGTCAELFDEDGIWGTRTMPEKPAVRDYHRFSPFIHPSVVFRAELFDEDNGYLETEETLRCEDYEIFMSLLQRGICGYNLQEILFKYRENSQSYSRRNFTTRLCEAKTRYRNFKAMGDLFPFGWIFVLRPVAACLVPSFIVGAVKRTEGSINRIKREKAGSGKAGETIRHLSQVQQNNREESLPLAGLRKLTG